MTDITRKRGDTYADEFVIISEATGQAIDVTGFTFLLTVDPDKSPINSDNNIYQLTGAITSAPEGIVEFVPSASQADRIGSFFYDAQMIDEAGRVRTFDSGKYKYTQDITK